MRAAIAAVAHARGIPLVVDPRPGGIAISVSTGDARTGLAGAAPQLFNQKKIAAQAKASLGA